jgi:hypothetical protein
VKSEALHNFWAQTRRLEDALAANPAFAAFRDNSKLGTGVSIIDQQTLAVRWVVKIPTYSRYGDQRGKIDTRTQPYEFSVSINQLSALPDEGIYLMLEERFIKFANEVAQ